MLRPLSQTQKHLFAIAAVAMFALSPIMIEGIPGGNDVINHYSRAVSFYDAVRSGTLYPGWNHQATKGFGDLGLRFFPPMFHYLLAFTRALTGSWYFGSLLAFALLSVLGGAGAYLWAKTFLQGDLPMWAGLLYVLMPYRLNQIYQASLFAEYAGGAVLPFCFAFVYLVCRRGRARDVAGLAASYALLILTHLPLAVIGSLSFLIYALLVINRADIWKTLIRLSLAVALGLAASARYWVTVVAELQWLTGEKLQWYDYRYNFLFWKSVEGSTNWWAEILAAITIILLLPGFIFALRKQDDEPIDSARRTALLTIFSFLMATPLSKPLWDYIPKLKEVQFPWRWLAVASAVGSVMFAACIPYWMKKRFGRQRPLAMLAAACVLIPIAFTLLQVIRSANYASRADFDSFIERAPASNSLASWLPIWAKTGPRQMNNEVEMGSRNFSLLYWNPYRRSFQVEPGKEQEARVRTFYYPHWMATGNGQPLSTRPDSDGALLVSVPGEGVIVVLEFREPARVTVAAIISLVGWILICALLLPLLNPGRRGSKTVT